jgi:F-type H+-transporting ATPase subunit b
MPQFDPALFSPQLVWLTIAFGILWLLMARIGLPRVERAMVERSQQIESDLDAARDMKKEADALTARYEATLADARAKSAAIAERTKIEIRAHSDKIMGEVEARLDKKIADSQAAIDKDIADALKEVDAIAAEIAATVVTRLTGDDVADKAIKDAIAHIRSEAA